MYATQLVGRQTLEVLVCFDGAILGAHHLGKGQSLTFGPAEARPDYPALGLATPLSCAAFGDAMSVVFPEGADGSVTLADGTRRTVEELLAAGQCTMAEGGHRYELPHGAKAEFPVGSLRVTATATVLSAPAVPRRRPTDWRSHRFMAASLLLNGTVLGLALLAPPDPRALASQDLSRLDNQALTRLIPVVAEVQPEKVLAAVPGGGASKPMRGPEGRAGGDHPDRHRIARTTQAQQAVPHGGTDIKAEAEKWGILSTLGRQKGPAADLFDARQGVLTDEVRKAVDGVQATFDEDGWGTHGGSIMSSSTGGPCEGPSCGTIRSTLDRICTGKNCGNGPGGGPDRRGPGTLTGLRHRPEAPEVIVDNTATVTRGLDKETVRRVIRSRMNQFRHCYERELLRQPDLGGRVVVSFVIGKAGQVLSAVPRESSVGSPAVAECVSEAVRRLSFPQPEGAAPLVQVSYPFLFQTAGK